MIMKASTHRFLSVLPTLTAACLLTCAADWPEFRGPKRDDHSPDTNLPKEWPAKGPNLAWKASDLGMGYSGVSVVGDRVFTSGDKNGKSVVIALNLADGKAVWEAPLGKAGAPGWGGFIGPRSTPTVNGGMVYALGQYGEMVCYDAANGKEIWKKHYVEDFGGKLPEWGFSESLLIDGDNVLGTPGGADGTVIALNKKTGATVWRSKGFTDNADYSSLVPVEIDGVRQYIQLTQKSVAGVGTDGKLLWQAPRKGATAVIPTPIYKDHHVYVTSGYNSGCNLFKVTKEGDGFKATEVWKNKVMENHHGGAVLVGDYVYGHSEKGGWTCQNFKTGEAVWQEGGKLKKGSLTYADGHLYLREEEGAGSIALVEATPKGYVEKSRFEQPDRSDKNSWPHPVVIGGRLFIRDQGILLCYQLKKS